MIYKRIAQFIVVLAVVVSAFGFAGSASAWSCSTYITVQWGDTLSGIASLCGTTVDAIRAANPGLGWVDAHSFRKVINGGAGLF